MAVSSQLTINDILPPNVSNILHRYPENVVKQSKNIRKILLLQQFNQGGRVIKALDLGSNGLMSAWFRTPPLVKFR